jgi:hypothetical protein
MGPPLRFQKFKPVPSKGKFVSVTDFLTGVERDEDHTVKHFLIDVDQVAFLGQQSAPPKAKQSPTKIGVFNLSNFFDLILTKYPTSIGLPGKSRRRHEIWRTGLIQCTTFKFNCPHCPHIIVELDENPPVAKHGLLLVMFKGYTNPYMFRGQHKPVL